MFGLFKKREKKEKSCVDCKYYSEYKSPDELNKDKTVTKGTLIIQSCRKMDDLLSDTKPCPMYSYTSENQCYGHAMAKALKKNGL